MATMANEGEGGGPVTEESQGMEELSPVMSYEKGTDHIEPVTSNGEIKYAVGGSQGTQPQKTDAIEGEDPQDETDTVSIPLLEPGATGELKHNRARKQGMSQGKVRLARTMKTEESELRTRTPIDTMSKKARSL